jgi:hypothetical protein
VLLATDTDDTVTKVGLRRIIWNILDVNQHAIVARSHGVSDCVGDPS